MTKAVQMIVKELGLNVTIRELDRVEMNKLLADDIYKHFFPVRCNSCGTKNGFKRHIFHLAGVQKKKQADDVTQNMLQYHFLHYHKIKHVFFRVYSKKFYADSAKCSSCKSTAIVFDISPDYIDRVISEYKKTAGDNVTHINEK